MNKRLLDVDPLTHSQTWHYYDPETDETTIEEIQDPTFYVELNKETQKDADYSKRGIKNEWWHIARIPNAIIHKWMVEEGINVMDNKHWPRVKKKLNDPEWRYLRTGLGRV